LLLRKKAVYHWYSGLIAEAVVGRNIWRWCVVQLVRGGTFSALPDA
jgi:hypothetical protein